MNRRLFWIVAIICALLITAPVMAFGLFEQIQATNQSTPGTAFTYQGQVKKAGAPVNSTCNLKFVLYDALSGGNQVGASQNRSAVVVTNGNFTIADLDFGAGAFNGEPRWLEMALNCTGDSGFTILAPRQPLSPVPYAQFAQLARVAQPRLISVYPVGTATQNGTALLAAMAGISDATADNPVVLHVMAGVYDLGTASLAMKHNVDVEGSGELQTIIQGSGTDCVNGGGVAFNRGTVIGASYAELRRLTIKNTGGGQCVVGMYNDAVAPHLSQVTIIIVSGGSVGTTGMLNTDTQNNHQNPQAVLEMDEVTVMVDTSGIGIFNFIGSVVEINDSTVMTNDGTAIENNNATVKLLRVSASAAGSSGDQVGVTCGSPMSTAYCVLEMDDVRIQGATHTFQMEFDHPAAVTVRINNSILNGGAVDLGPGPIYPNVTCRANYDETNTFFPDTCP